MPYLQHSPNEHITFDFLNCEYTEACKRKLKSSDCKFHPLLDNDVFNPQWIHHSSLRKDSMKSFTVAKILDIYVYRPTHTGLVRFDRMGKFHYT